MSLFTSISELEAEITATSENSRYAHTTNALCRKNGEFIANKIETSLEKVVKQTKTVQSTIEEIFSNQNNTPALQ